jgi:hypothetical protein
MTVLGQPGLSSQWELPPIVSTAQITSIGNALDVVANVRSIQLQQPHLSDAVKSIKMAQVQRFRYSYSDVLVHPDLGPAARFFLSELYSERDFSHRDQQFSRIAPTMQRLFPRFVTSVATTLVQLHALSEQLDHQMGVVFAALSPNDVSLTAALHHYVQIWRAVGQRDARFEQLSLIQILGTDLAKLTQQRGLRTMLKLMRSPAQAAGLDQLQAFLELGFDTFNALQRSSSGVDNFLPLVQQRESHWLNRLFDSNVAFSQNTQYWPELE